MGEVAAGHSWGKGLRAGVRLGEGRAPQDP